MVSGKGSKPRRTEAQFEPVTPARNTPSDDCPPTCPRFTRLPPFFCVKTGSKKNDDGVVVIRVQRPESRPGTCSMRSEVVDQAAWPPSRHSHPGAGPRQSIGRGGLPFNRAAKDPSHAGSPGISRSLRTNRTKRVLGVQSSALGRRTPRRLRWLSCGS
jgi:hypothetical protein